MFHAQRSKVENSPETRGHRSYHNLQRISQYEIRHILYSKETSDRIRIGEQYGRENGKEDSVECDKSSVSEKSFSISGSNVEGCGCVDDLKPNRSSC